MTRFGKAYDDWLEAPYQEAEERANAIDEIASELMQDEYNPQDVDVFLAAIDDACLYSIREKLKTILSEGQGYLALGEAIWDAVHDHELRAANALAAERYNAGLRGDFDEPY